MNICRKKTWVRAEAKHGNEVPRQCVLRFVGVVRVGYFRSSPDRRVIKFHRVVGVVRFSVVSWIFNRTGHVGHRQRVDRFEIVGFIIVVTKLVVGFKQLILISVSKIQLVIELKLK